MDKEDKKIDKEDKKGDEEILDRKTINEICKRAEEYAIKKGIEVNVNERISLDQAMRIAQEMSKQSEILKNINKEK